MLNILVKILHHFSVGPPMFKNPLHSRYPDLSASTLNPLKPSASATAGYEGNCLKF